MTSRSPGLGGWQDGSEPGMSTKSSRTGIGWCGLSLEDEALVKRVLVLSGLVCAQRCAAEIARARLIADWSQHPQRETLGKSASKVILDSFPSSPDLSSPTTTRTTTRSSSTMGAS